MARMIDADELEMFPYSEVAGTEEQIADWIEQVGLSGDDTASRARNLCWKVIEGFINVVKTQPTLTQPNEPLTLEKLENMEDTTPVWWDQINSWVLVYKGNLTTWSGKHLYAKGCNGKFYRRPPEGEHRMLENVHRYC